MKHGVKRLFALFLAAVMVCVMFVIPALAISFKSTVVDGHKYTIYTALDKRMALSAISNNIQIHASLWGDRQIFTISKVSGEWYKIVNPFTGKVLDVSNGSAKNGTNVLLWSYQGGDNQLWKFVKDGDGYRIQSKLGPFLDVTGGNPANDTNVQIYEGNKTYSQLWYLDDLDNGFAVNDACFWDFDGTPQKPLELPYAITPRSSTLLPLIYIRAGETVTRTVLSRGANVVDLSIEWYQDGVAFANRNANASKSGLSITTAPDSKYTQLGGANSVGVKQFTISADSGASGFYVAHFSWWRTWPNGKQDAWTRPNPDFYVFVDPYPAK